MYLCFGAQVAPKQRLSFVNCAGQSGAKSAFCGGEARSAVGYRCPPHDVVPPPLQKVEVRAARNIFLAQRRSFPSENPENASKSEFRAESKICGGKSAHARVKSRWA